MDYQTYLPHRIRIIKEKLRNIIKVSKIKHEYLAAQLGISSTRLQQFLSEDEDGRFHLDNLPIFLRETGDISILKDIAAMFGRVAFPLPKVYESLSDLNREVLKGIQETTEYFQAIAQAVDDALITPPELEKVERECAEAMAQLARLLEVFKQMEKGQEKKLRAVSA